MRAVSFGAPSALLLAFAAPGYTQPQPTAGNLEKLSNFQQTGTVEPAHVPQTGPKADAIRKNLEKIRLPNGFHISLYALVPDARHIGDSLVARQVRLQLGTMVYDPADPMGKMFFNILATFAEFEVDLLRLRTCEDMAIAKARGKLKGRALKLSPARQAHLLQLHAAGEHTVVELAELFEVSRPTVYRVLERAGVRAGAAA